MIKDTIDDEALAHEVRRVIERPDWTPSRIKRIREAIRPSADPKPDWEGRKDRALRQLEIAWELKRLSDRETSPRSFIHRLARRTLDHVILELRDLTAAPQS